MIPDEDAIKPDDWDEDMDGEWEAPLVPNPMCQSAPGCGPWKKPFIDNPLYKGKWFPPMINNPNYKVKLLSKKFVKLKYVMYSRISRFFFSFPIDSYLIEHF